MPSWVALICILLMVLAIFQAIIGLINRYIGPLQQRKIPTRKSSRGLLKAGFLPVSCEKVHHGMDGPASAVALVGTLDGFAVEISSNYLTGWGKFPFYRIRVFFNTDNLSYDELLIRQKNNLGRSKFFRWNDDIKLAINHTEWELIVDRSGPPSSEQVIVMAKELIDELKKLGLQPVDYVEGVEKWNMFQD